MHMDNGESAKLRWSSHSGGACAGEDDWWRHCKIKLDILKLFGKGQPTKPWHNILFHSHNIQNS